jgi:hypothetical protein
MKAVLLSFIFIYLRLLARFTLPGRTGFSNQAFDRRALHHVKKLGRSRGREDAKS